MDSVAVLSLDDPSVWNRWIIGTPEEVPESSPFYSRQIQIAFVNNPEKGLLEKGIAHSHEPPHRRILPSIGRHFGCESGERDSQFEAYANSQGSAHEKT